MIDLLAGISATTIGGILVYSIVRAVPWIRRTHRKCLFPKPAGFIWEPEGSVKERVLGRRPMAPSPYDEGFRGFLHRNDRLRS